ncbi:Hsp20/alpha crystallin family protein [Actinoallomurus sp. NPDC052274]|uniref:Hsp20/alpha crystallin family protein n=1 Tax=Actinoallomurus sp. NPDC052274 TaxID=3155420 RepID=UPI003413F10C
MGTPARREPRLPDLFDLMEMPFTTLRPFTAQAIRIEDYLDDDKYVIRAELPGIDPSRDVEISVSRGILTIRAEREERREGRRHSEFRYGTYERHVRLPDRVREEDITAAYDQGILTVTVPLQEAKEATRRIPIQH